MKKAQLNLLTFALSFLSQNMDDDVTSHLAEEGITSAPADLSNLSALFSSLTEKSGDAFLVVWHEEGYEPSSTLVIAQDGKEAWQKTVAEYVLNTGDDSRELYCDSIKPLTQLLQETL